MSAILHISSLKAETGPKRELELNATCKLNPKSFGNYLSR
jgi:hypothetical protein